VFFYYFSSIQSSIKLQYKAFFNKAAAQLCSAITTNHSCCKVFRTKVEIRGHHQKVLRKLKHQDYYKKINLYWSPRKQ